MFLPRAEFAFVEATKVLDYLLCSSDPVGRNKARWFQGLGYEANDPHRLISDLLLIARQGDLMVEQELPYGAKYVIIGSINTPSGKRARMVTVWIQEPTQKGPRLVTAYPAQEVFNE